MNQDLLKAIPETTNIKTVNNETGRIVQEDAGEKGVSTKKELKHSRVDWDRDRPRIILYADIMGFKAKLAQTPHDKVVKELRKFVVAVSRHLSPYQTGGHLRMTLFSDLIVIASDSDSLKNFKLIINAAAALLHECHAFKFPINGCIAKGALAFDEAETIATMAVGSNENIMQAITQGRKGQYMPLFVGKSIVDAYLLNEEMFFYGIVLHQTAEPLLYDYRKIGPAQLPFYKIPVPLKTRGKANLYYLDWPQIKLAKNTCSQQDILDYLNNLEPKVGVRPRAYIYNTIKIIEAIENLKNSKH